MVYCGIRTKQLIEGHPAKVDYPVAPTAADWAAGKDPILEKAISLIKKPGVNCVAPIAVATLKGGETYA